LPVKDDRSFEVLLQKLLGYDKANPVDGRFACKVVGKVAAMMVVARRQLMRKLGVLQKTRKVTRFNLLEKRRISMMWRLKRRRMAKRLARNPIVV